MAERRAISVWMLTTVHDALDTRIFYRQARSMAAAGFRVTIVAPGAPSGPKEGVEFRAVPSFGGRAGRVVRWPIAFWQAARARSDVYHVHDPELLPWGLLLQWVTGRPVIYDSHEFLAESILSKLWLPAWLRHPLARIADPLEKAVAARLAAVVAVTPEMADRFRRVQPRTVVVMNLPPTPSLPPHAESPGPIAIYAGLMNRERGLDLLRGTATAVRRRHPRFELRVLGPVEWQGLDAERAQPETAWADAGVRFLGSVAQPDVAGELAQARIGWLPMNGSIPSKRLAWPVKLGEYMAAGLPVVASDLPVQAQVIREAGCGVVVDEFTPDAHGAAISELLDDPARARSLGEAGQRYARERLSWEGQADRLAALYRELAGRLPVAAEPTASGTAEGATGSDGPDGSGGSLPGARHEPGLRPERLPGEAAPRQPDDRAAVGAGDQERAIRR